MDDDVRRLVLSWPKLETSSHWQSIYFLVDFEDNCRELSCIASFANSIGYFYHPIFRYLYQKPLAQFAGAVGKAQPSTSTQTWMEYQIQVTRYLDLIFLYMKSIEVLQVPSKDKIWLGIRDLVTHALPGSQTSY